MRFGNILKDIERWIAYRTYDKYNVIKIKTLPPSYYDKPEMLIHGMFALLTDYVEIELASLQRYNEDIKQSPRDLGLKYLKEYQEMRPEFPEEKESLNFHIKIAKETEDLYLWWNDIYLKRLDEMEESGYNEYYDFLIKKYGEVYEHIKSSSGSFYEMKFVGTKEEDKKQKKILDKCWALEKKHRKEDETMLIRLIKIRECLWT